jgi:hypothetical protein
LAQVEAVAELIGNELAVYLHAYASVSEARKNFHRPLSGVLQLRPAALQPESAHARSGILQPPARIYGSLKTKTRTST